MCVLEIFPISTKSFFIFSPAWHMPFCGCIVLDKSVPLHWTSYVIPCLLLQCIVLYRHHLVHVQIYLSDEFWDMEMLNQRYCNSDRYCWIGLLEDSNNFHSHLQGEIAWAIHWAEYKQCEGLTFYMLLWKYPTIIAQWYNKWHSEDNFCIMEICLILLLLLESFLIIEAQEKEELRQRRSWS